MAAVAVANGDITASKSSPVAGRFSNVYSELQRSRIDHSLPLPRVVTQNFNVVDGPNSSATGNPDEIAKLFPCLFGQPSSIIVASESEGLSSDQKLKIGVVLSGGQAPGGHNITCKLVPRIVWCMDSEVALLGS
ncbi:Pyrophosphate--fructose 6-phosphate 1-phosphotransferase subunit beta 2 [Bienertia sinuspersici]